MDYIDTTVLSNVTHGQCKVVVSPYTLTLTIFSCVLSILGSGIIFITYANVVQIRNFTRKLLLSLTVADLFTAVGNLMGSIRYLRVISEPRGCRRIHFTDGFCVFQSFVSTFASMASFFWTTVIAIHIYLQIRSGSSGMRSASVFMGYQLICWGVPGIIIIAASAFDVLGSDNFVGTGSWCWIRKELDDRIQIVWMILAGKGWEILCYVLTACLYILSKIAIWVKRREVTWQRFTMEQVEDMRNEDENFLYVPLVLYILRVWGTARFLLAVNSRHVNNVHVTRAQEVLLAFQGIGDSGQAFLNCIVFCFCDKTVRAYLCTAVCRRRNHVSRNSEINERTPIA